MSSTLKTRNGVKSKGDPTPAKNTPRNVEDEKEEPTDSNTIPFAANDESGERSTGDVKRNLEFDTESMTAEQDLVQTNWRQNWPMFGFLQNPRRKGFLLLAAIMKIGVVYGFLSTLKKINDSLFHNKHFIGVFYRFIYHVTQYTKDGIYLVVTVWFAMLLGFFVTYGPQALVQKVSKMYEDLERRYLKADEDMANQLTDYIDLHPWMEKTTLELLDDLLHWMITKLEHILGLPSKITMLRMQAQKSQELFSQFHQIHLKSIPTNFFSRGNGHHVDIGKAM